MTPLRASNPHKGMPPSAEDRLTRPAAKIDEIDQDVADKLGNNNMSCTSNEALAL